MTTYNVHLYREMRLYFPGVDAESPEAAARIAAEKSTDEANYVEDCEGETLSALVDVQGDAEYRHTRFIDFQPTLLGNKAVALLKAVGTLIEKADDLEAAIAGVTDQFEDEVAALSAAVTAVETTMTPSTLPTRTGSECQKTVEQHLAALDAATDYFLALAGDRRPKVVATKEWLEYVSASIVWAQQEIERQS
jgi:hypothetical protein